jgi:hypothetical protein
MIKKKYDLVIIKKESSLTVDKIIYALIILYVLAIAIISLNREYYNYNTETDYLGGFVPEAQRILNSEPLLVQFHPPFYAAAIAVVYGISADWLKAGIILSVLSSLLLMLSSYHFIKKNFGEIEGIGSVVILFLSPTFLSFSMLATSDLFSVSLMMLAFYFLGKSQENEKRYWVLLTGFLVGISILTRTNGIVLLAFLLFFLSFKNYRIQIDKKIVFLLIGILTPIFIWIGYASVSNSHIAPVKTYENLALTYYSNGDRISGDARAIAAKGFSSSFDVIFKDPLHTAKVYTRDFLKTTKQLSNQIGVMGPPFAQLGIPCFLFLMTVFMFRNFYFFVIFLNLIFLFLLTNLKAFEPRYYLYFLPFFGAGIAHTGKILYNSLDRNKPYPRLLFSVIATAVILFSGARALHGAYSYQKNNTSTDAFVASNCLRSIKDSNDDIVISRKPHVSFYSDMQGHMIPNVTTIEELENEIYTHYFKENRNTFLFFGMSESKVRKELRPILLDNPNSVQWLEAICSGNEEGGWILYRVRNRDGQ